jgi:hypothetical protein
VVGAVHAVRGVRPGGRPTISEEAGDTSKERVVVYWRGRRRAMFGAIVAVLIPLSSVVAAQAETFSRTFTDSPLQSDPFAQQGPQLIWSGCGNPVALSGDGNTLLVGCPSPRPLAGGSQAVGAARVYTRSGSSWPEQVELHPTDAIAPPWSPAAFGKMVALSHDGNTALIGGRGDNGGHGAAWVFTREGSTWTQQGRKLLGSEEQFEDCGNSVSLSSDGNTALMGCGGGGGRLAGEEAAGAAYFFTRSGSTWTQQGPRVTGSGGHFGTAVALSGDGGTALVAANATSPPTATVFVRSGSEWVQQGPPLSVASAPWEGNGLALSSDGNTAWVGESAFVRSGSTWTKQAQFSGSSSLGQGVALSADGNLALLGEDSAAQVFVRSGSSWSLRETVKPSTEGSLFGLFAALSSDASTAAIGGSSGAWVFIGQAKKAKEVKGTCSVVNVSTGQGYGTLQGGVDSVPGENGEGTLSVSGTCYGDTIVSEKKLTIVGHGHATLDGDNSAANPGTVVSFDGGRSAPAFAITGLTITGGYRGAGIEVSGYNTSLTLNSAKVTGNTGSGISAYESILTLNDSSVSGNTGYGGGIDLGEAYATLNNSSVSDNSASGCGGGISLVFLGKVTLNNSTVARNTTSGNGGGICVEEEESQPQDGLTMNGSSSVSHNTAAGNGGGVYDEGGVKLNDSASVTRNTASGKGGGIYNYQTKAATITYETGWSGTVSGNKPDDIFNF